ncbi:ras-related and estrogen-regulated growth inhibitor-like protein isoform X1 [Chiloscyllium plagiosum]|uniref:ras-related and estrogen-regulated growth inhibitor-like protein isoform X1 n=1 Tax=Chiloscyllium plagiosum TaxID=36176 RepID=UPI001CB80CD3|nr:ras-related and estrogen-regulated growth inhibitor-like protein isoform X1 [Chiloscyllium plagiosum]
MVLHTKSRECLAVPGQERLQVNILILGAERVGKSALAVRFLTRRFIGEYGDIETIYTHNVTIDRAETRFHIWDCLNLQPSEQQMRWADGFVLVYSILDRQSFEVARRQLAWLRGSARATVVLAGNKRDLCHRREVSVEEGRLLALGSGCAFLEVSAAEGYHGVLLVFRQLLAAVQEARAVPKRAARLRGIVRSVSAVFGGKRRVD